MANKTHQLIFGVMILLLVDVIWVLSNELTKFLYQNEDFSKPFFCTYFKTSMFTLYLLGLGLISPWRDQNGPNAFSSSQNQNINYSRMDSNGDDLDGMENMDTESSPLTQHATPSTSNLNDQSMSSNGNYSRLSDSIFVPIKDCSHSSSVSSEDPNETHLTPRPNRTKRKTSNVESNLNSSSSEDESSIRSVKFSKMAEVRELSPLEASEALMSRLSYSASMRIRRQKSHHKTARTALMFSILWFLGNYLYQLALEPSEAALVIVLSSTSNFFILILAAIFPSANGDRLTLSKCLAVFLSIGGVVLISWTEMNTEEGKIGRGICLSILSAFFYAAYLVLVKRKSDTEEKVNIPLFFGFVGLWNFLIMWPLFFVLNFSHVEAFEWPNRHQFSILFLNGLIGTVVSEALWLWGCFLTSSLIGTLAITLQIPLSMLMDVVFRHKVYPLMFYLGSIPIFVAIIFVAVLVNYEDSDPVLRIFKMCFRKLFSLRWRNQILRVNNELDDEQHECLINGHSLLEDSSSHATDN